jgi:hypothetical protein
LSGSAGVSERGLLGENSVTEEIKVHWKGRDRRERLDSRLDITKGKIPLVSIHVM